MNDEMIRQPPQSVEAEQNVLGALMIAPEALPRVAGWLSADDFCRADHRRIYRAIMALADESSPCDCVTVGEWCDGNGEAVDSGYLIELASHTASAANVEAYAEIVVEKSKLRQLIGMGSDIVNLGFEPKGRRSGEIAMEANSALLALSGGGRKAGPKSMRDVAGRWFNDLHSRYERGGGMIGMPTPWIALNRQTLGLCPGDLVILAGRPSMGKSAAAVNLATASCLSGSRTLFFNLEMTDVSIFNRAVASVMEIPLRWLRSGGKSDDNVDYWPRVTEGVKTLRDAPLLIDDRPGLTYQQIVAAAKREHLRAPLGLILIDHLHLLKLGKGETHREIQEATSAFKGLAKALGVPVVVLSQLNRGLESRPNKRPQMSDLRESGAIEQDADVILFLYRDDYYAEREGRASDYPGWIEIFVAKQREGEAGGTVWLRDGLAYGRLDDHDGEAPGRPVREQSKPRMVNRVGGRDRAAGGAG